MNDKAALALENYVPLNQQQRESKVVLVAEIDRLQEENMGLKRRLAVTHGDTKYMAEVRTGETARESPGAESS